MMIKNNTKNLEMSDKSIKIIDSLTGKVDFFSRVEEVKSIDIYFPERLENNLEVFIIFRKNEEEKATVTFSKLKNAFSLPYSDFTYNLEDISDIFSNINIEKKFYNMDKNPSKNIFRRTFLIFIFITILICLIGRKIQFF
ncbi:MAG: hypothetical protein JW924_12850 [Fusobacteriaceae bacterium]|nr:hypothetical protein [Fusobacteriaceae bacterium]